MVARVGSGGQQQRRPQQGSSLGSEYRIKSAVLHPDWYLRFHGQSGFDIALLKLAVPVSPDEVDVDTICLADANTTLAKTDKCYVVRWGLAETNSPCTVKGMPYRHLRGGAHGHSRRYHGLLDCRFTRSRRQREPLSALETRVMPVPLKKCVRSRLHPNKDHLICAGGAGRTVCTGDHGSSLYCLNSKTDRWFLHGVTGQHWRHRCSDAYSLFNSVPSVTAWIHQHIQ
ncbi:unnamed protein product [Dibothriocephalus latus]|uniref:Peptidase S1 domain-containing protein n=1 Tax=Dibothriocephalus latus TaxID=60516 RepID=A0A3P7KZA7_DIBLA|nr:unnamed protein product [Dibothriocephalus latus]